MLIYLTEAGRWGELFGHHGDGKYEDKLCPLLREAHRDFLDYKRLHKLQCSQPRFTPARCHRRLQTSFLAFVEATFAWSFRRLGKRVGWRALS